MLPSCIFQHFLIQYSAGTHPTEASSVISFSNIIQEQPWSRYNPSYPILILPDWVLQHRAKPQFGKNKLLTIGMTSRAFASSSDKFVPNYL